MRLKQAFAYISPPSLSRVKLREVFPLAIFVILFVAMWFFVEYRGYIRFSSPWMLLLLLVAPWIWWMQRTSLSGLSRLRRVLALMVRLSLVGIFIMLMAEPRAIRKSDILTVMYALDVSDSIGEKASTEALAYITRTVAYKPASEEAGLVVFGKEASVELPPRVSFPFEVINSRITRDATDIAKGLSLASAMIPEEKQGRIVLVTDGVQTEGALSNVLDEIRARHIPVDVLPVEYEYQDEVWLERLELPRFVKEGQTYEASVVLSSIRAGKGNLVFRENGQVICEQEVAFGPGKNRFVLPLHLREPGYYEYMATIELPPGKDGWRENNVAISYLHLKGRGKVLVVTSAEGESRDWQTLVTTLRTTQRLTELMPVYQFPRISTSLLPYDCVIFVNTPADDFEPAQLSALRDAVYNEGVGFLMIGGKDSFGPGGYYRTPAEEALPVTMDVSQRKVLPKGALVIVLHTCELPEGNFWGKRVAKEAVRVLSARDEVGALVYDWNGGEKWLFPLTPAREYERIVTLINQAQIGDMPSFSTTMKMGLDSLKSSDAAVKHMIIISDGDPSPPTPELLNDFRKEKVSISTVAINPHGQQDVGVMQLIASSTGGRFYFPQNAAQLPSIFIKEAKTLQRSMIQNIKFVPKVEFPSTVLKGIDDIPELFGYVLTTPKPRSITVLRGPETEEVDPVLIMWRFGIGKSAAFTSDLSPNWGKKWVEWEKYRAFVDQLITDVSRVEEQSSLQLRTFASGDEGTIVVDDQSQQGGMLEIQAEVTGPRQMTEVVRLKQTGVRSYEGAFQLWGKGQYQVFAAGAGDGRNERAFSGFAVPYSAEYLRFRANPILLAEIAAKTGGRMLTGRESGKDIFVKEPAPKESSRPVADIFLLILACLVPLDVAIRRIQLDVYVIRQWLRSGPKKVADTTLGALLRRKKEIALPSAEKPSAMPPPVKIQSRVAPAGKKEKAAPAVPEPLPAKKPKEAEAEKISTLERLVRKKKKWKKEDGES